MQVNLMVRLALVFPVLACGSMMWAAPELFPAAVGNKWEYETAKLVRAELTVDGKLLAIFGDVSSGSSVYEFVSADDKQTPPVFDYTETSRLTSANGQQLETSKSEVKLRSDCDALMILATVNSNSHDPEPERQDYNPPLLYFYRKAAPGKTWNVGIMRDGEVKSPVSARIAGTETVTVPAGTFKNCTKVIYSSDQFTGTIELMKKKFKLISGRSRGIYWCAADVGIVKELEVSTSTAEADAEGGKKIKMHTAVCTVNELKPGYVVKKSTVDESRSAVPKR